MPRATPPATIQDVVSVHDYGDPGDAPSLLIEVPHGATTAAHFDRLLADLCGSYPANLKDFFFVNTDVGTFELATSVAEAWADRKLGRRAWVVRSLIPRTFIDCNRVIEDASSPSEGRANDRVTPGIHSYVTDPRDRGWLMELHGRYATTTASAYTTVCGDSGGRALMLHSYAPRSLQIETDADIVRSLHREYRPDRIEHWPLRAEVDLIADDPEGRRLADPAMVDGVRSSCESAGYEVSTCGTYSLHDGTFAREYSERHPGRTLCIEFRRDLLVPEFTPFAEMRGELGKIDRAASAILAGLD